MIASEDTKQGKLNTKIQNQSTTRDNALGQIDLSNGASKAEYKDSKVAQKSANKVMSNYEKANKLDMVDQKRTIMKQVPEATINGQQYRKGEINGQEVYFRDTIQISKEDYEKALKA